LERQRPRAKLQPLPVALLLFGAAGAQPVADYLIITPARLAPSFGEFARWKTAKGLWTEVVPVESVLARSTGRDRAEKVRNFIRLYSDSLGTDWVLLAGDTTDVPARMVATPGNVTDYAPSDLYFSDLDGDWDANHNNIFGEEADSVDFYANVFVGRASVTDTAEVRAVTGKWLEFEQGPEPGFLRKLIQAGDTASISTPPGWFKAHLPDPPGRYEFRDSLLSGFQFVSHIGHATNAELLVGTQVILNLSDVYALTNLHRQGVFLSVGCEVGAFDMTCIGAALLTHAGGGSIAVLANTRAGWVGCSEMLSFGFLNRFFQTDSCAEVGRNLCRTRDNFVPLARTQWRWRQSLCVWNLLGEPSLPGWKDSPGTLSVTHPLQLDTGAQELPIAVQAGGAPTRALVCAWKDSEVYERRWIDGSGTIPIHPRSPGEMLVTVTKPDHLPYQGSCGIATAVAESGPTVRGQTVRLSIGPAGITIASRSPAVVELHDLTGRARLGPFGLPASGVRQVACAAGVWFVRARSRGFDWRGKAVVVR
jgi:hypothetical protein